MKIKRCPECGCEPVIDTLIHGSSRSDKVYKDKSIHCVNYCAVMKSIDGDFNGISYHVYTSPDNCPTDEECYEAWNERISKED